MPAFVGSGMVFRFIVSAYNFINISWFAEIKVSHGLPKSKSYYF
jgi:hypothetical protein